MTNRFLGEGQVVAGGVTYRLRFDMNVLADLEERTGKNSVDVMKALDGGGSVKALREICHAMMMLHHPEATLLEAGNVISENLQAVMQIITSAMPPDDKARAPGNRAAKAGARR
jgi:hypothetical protein